MSAEIYFVDIYWLTYHQEGRSFNHLRNTKNSQAKFGIKGSSQKQVLKFNIQLAQITADSFLIMGVGDKYTPHNNEYI